MSTASDDAGVPAVSPDEPAGDIGDQASRLQMAQEQEAIRAALAGDVHGSDALDRDAVVEPLEGEDPMAAEEADSSDDPLHGGGEVPGDDEPAPTSTEQLGDLMALDEGSSVDDAGAAPLFEEDGDPEAGGPQTD